MATTQLQKSLLRRNYIFDRHNERRITSNDSIAIATKSLPVRARGIRSKRPRLEHPNRRHLRRSEKSAISRFHPEVSSAFVAVTQSAVTSILAHWLRSAVRSDSAQRRRIMSILSAYSIQRFEFDETHSLIQSWINFAILAEDDAVAANGAHRARTTPIVIASSLTSDPEHECPTDLDVEDTSVSASSAADAMPPLLSPTTSISASISSSLSAAAAFSASSASLSVADDVAAVAPRRSVEWECTASLPAVKWGTIFLGNILDAALLRRTVYVCNVSVDQIGYGVGVALVGHRRHEFDDETFCNVTKLTDRIQRAFGGYPDAMDDCFCIYDDGAYHDWHRGGGGNVNDLPAVYPGSASKQNANGTVKVSSKLSRHPLRATKRDDANLSPNCPRSPTQRAFYRGPRRRRKKRVGDKFGFDEKRDTIQIAVDLQRRRVSIHNLQSHRCVEVRGFRYDSVRIGFALRQSKVTVLDQKWI